MIDDFRAQVHKLRQSGDSVGFRPVVGRIRQALEAVALARPSRLQSKSLALECDC